MCSSLLLTSALNLQPLTASETGVIQFVKVSATPTNGLFQLNLELFHLNSTQNSVLVSVNPKFKTVMTHGTSKMLIQFVRENSIASETNAQVSPGSFKSFRYQSVETIPFTLTQKETLAPLDGSWNAVEVALIPSGITEGHQATKPLGEINPKSEVREESEFNRWWSQADDEHADFKPGQFFKDHFFGYEPFYFIAGAESPNARFQISLRYQLLNREGALAQKAPWLNGVSFAYTQTSLWDLAAPSTPFFDTSYKPELLYLWKDVDRGSWGENVDLDLQWGAMHESNGKGGVDSRSLNIVYFRPSVSLGKEDGFQVRLSPRVWFYTGGLDDNPDLKDYRGYVDLKTTFGWQRGFQLAATGRVGDDAEKASLQLDLTYPMMSLFSRSFSLYLHAQYFTGYGESLLLYNEKGDSFRVGFGLFR